MAWIGSTVGVAADTSRRQAGESEGPPASAEAVSDIDKLYYAGEAVAARVCGSECHQLDEVYYLRRSSAEWTRVISDMAMRGAAATPTDIEKIERFLVRFYGIVFVNSAPADELAAVLGLTEAQAEAVVAYRTDHGPFADADALLKVPGIDPERIAEQPGALVFE